MTHLVATAAPAELAMIEVSIARTHPTPTHLMNEAIAEGRVTDEADREAVRTEIVRAQEATIAAAQLPTVKRVTELGGQIVARRAHTHSMTIMLPVGKVGDLLREASIERVDLPMKTTDQAPSAVALRTSQQLDQFIDNGFNGERGENSDISFALIEGGAIDDDIYCYREASGTGARIREMYECGNASCTGVSGYGSPSWHTTKVAALLFGDLEDGQDPNVTNSIERIRRSGFATEAKGYFYQKVGSDSSASLSEAIDHIASIASYQPIVANMSFGSSAGSGCSGGDSQSRAVDELFESGTLPFAAAGNTFHEGSSCTVIAPSGAIGAFTVGAYGNINSTTLADVADDGVCEETARGGADRTIVDLVAYAPRDLSPQENNIYAAAGCYTSYATPAAAGAAIDFADHYFEEFGSFLEDPGQLKAAMLLMGDRRASHTTYLNTRYNNVYGAGRMRMRRWDNVGMDNPWGFGLGSTCIDDGESYTIPINDGTPLAADVNVIKAVIWWYDSRYEDGVEIDDVDLRLIRNGTIVANSNSTADEKERVYYQTNGSSGITYGLRIDGEDITADNAGCGTNSMKVYFAYHYEDSDRDDLDGGPGSEISTE